MKNDQASKQVFNELKKNVPVPLKSCMAEYFYDFKYLTLTSVIKAVILKWEVFHGCKFVNRSNK